MINIPIWLLIVLIVGCVPTALVAISFAWFIASNAIRDIIDEKQRK